MELGAVIAELENNRRSQFDPSVVDALIKIKIANNVLVKRIEKKAGQESCLLLKNQLVHFPLYLSFSYPPFAITFKDIIK